MHADDDPSVTEGFSPKLGIGRRETSRNEGIQAARPENRMSVEEAESFRLPPLAKKKSLPLTIAWMWGVFGVIFGLLLLLVVVMSGRMNHHEFRYGLGLVVFFSGMCAVAGFAVGIFLELLGVNE